MTSKPEMQGEILPCPVCRGNMLSVEADIWVEYRPLRWRVHCNLMGCKTKWFPDRQAAIDYWQNIPRATSTPAPSAGHAPIDWEAMKNDSLFVDKLAREIHEGLGGNGWAYMNYGGDEMRLCRAELFKAARAAISYLRERMEGKA